MLVTHYNVVNFRMLAYAVLCVNLYTGANTRSANNLTIRIVRSMHFKHTSNMAVLNSVMSLHLIYSLVKLLN